MKQIRRHLTYSNVMSSIAVFAVLGGAAVAASQVPRKSVGTKQLKANAVTTAKIKRNAVTKVKIKRNAVTNAKLANEAVTGEKIADGSVSGVDIDAASTSFSQLVARIRGTAEVPFANGTLYPLLSPSYTQAAGRTDEFFAAVDVNFAESCKPPRSAQVLLMLDAADPLAPEGDDLIGFGFLEDPGTGSVTRSIQVGTYPVVGRTMSVLAPAAATPHTFSILLSNSDCDSGSGVTVTGAGIDVIGTK